MENKHDRSKSLDEIIHLFNGQNTEIGIDENISSFSKIKKEFDKCKIPFSTTNSYIDWGVKPKEKLDLVFYSKTNFQNLYIISTILRNYGLTSLGYYDDDINAISIGYSTSKTIEVDLFLSLPFETNMKTLLYEYFGVEDTTMDINIREWIKKTYNIQNPEDCTEKDIEKVKEISLKDKDVKTIEGLERFKNLEIIKLTNDKMKYFDMACFPNLKELDISSNSVEKLDISKNVKLEQISIPSSISQIDFSNNRKLKKITGGSGLTQIDLSNNYEVENIDIWLSMNSFRYIDVRNCSKLKSINLMGVGVPFVNLTNNNNLEYVRINYWNTYKGKGDEYGNGYPRPIIFVNENFNENMINSEDRNYKYFCYFLVRVEKGSKEESALQILENMKSEILGIGQIKSSGFFSGTQIRWQVANIAEFHYEILKLLNG